MRKLPEGAPRLASALAPLLALTLAGCSIAPQYATAKLARKGELQVTPSVTGRMTHLRVAAGEDGREDDLEAKGRGVSLGAAAAYGISDHVNAGLRYERFPSQDGRPDHFLHGEFKFGNRGESFAASLGYGYLVNGELHQMTVSTFANVPLKDDMVYCFSPQWSFLFEGKAVFFDVTLNNALAVPVGDHLTVIPQIGINAIPLLTFGGIAMNVGIAGQLTF